MTRLTKLRPVVQATALDEGVHVRGWNSAFTVRGGPALFKVWQHLELRLADGIPGPDLTPPGAPEHVVRAYAALEAELRSHDMLVEVPAAWSAGGPRQPCDETASWLASVATNPSRAWERLSEATFTVFGWSPIAAATTRALRRLGLNVTHGDGQDGLAMPYAAVSAAGMTLWMAGDDSTGFVGPPRPHDRWPTIGVPDRIEEVRARLGIGRPAASPTALHSLLGGNAAHRLLCAVGGLPDPGIERGARGVAPEWRPSAVFVARMDPLRGDYQPWTDGTPAAGHECLDVIGAAHRVDALCNADLGPLAGVLAADIVQVPAALSVLRGHGGTFAAVGTTTELARLSAARAAAQAQLGGSGYAGADAMEARGRALRAAWASVPGGPPVGDAAWAGHPAARRWWKALTLHFGVTPQLVVTALAPEVHRATLTLPDRPPTAAIEAEPGDAAAFAILHAVGVLQVSEAGTGASAADLTAPCGASPGDGEEEGSVPWPADSWTWPTFLRRREPQLQRRLSVRPDGSAVRLESLPPHALGRFAATHSAEVAR